MIGILFTLQNIMFGFEDKTNDALKCIVISIKQQMFICKLNSMVPLFDMLKKKVLQYYKDDKYIGRLPYSSV